MLQLPPNILPPETSTTGRRRLPIASQTSWSATLPSRGTTMNNPDWPFAASSTGEYLGYLKMGRFRRTRFWQAKGEARIKFDESIRGKVLSHLREHSAILQKPASTLVLSLFMVGRAAERTKPTVMLQSDDKEVRKETFNLLKESDILNEYPGFELGCCSLSAEFEGLRQTGGPGAASKSALSGDADEDLSERVGGLSMASEEDLFPSEPSWTTTSSSYSRGHERDHKPWRKNTSRSKGTKFHSKSAEHAPFYPASSYERQPPEPSPALHDYTAQTYYPNETYHIDPYNREAPTALTLQGNFSTSYSKDFATPSGEQSAYRYSSGGDSLFSASPNLQEGTLVSFQNPWSSLPREMDGRSGTAAGFVHVRGRTMLLTVNHIRPGRGGVSSNKGLGEDDESDDNYEITGLEDDYTSQDESLELKRLVEATSRGSQSPESIYSLQAASSALGDSSSLAYYSSRESSRVNVEKSEVELDSRSALHSSPPRPSYPSRAEEEGMVPVGKVVFSSTSLDFCLVELDLAVTSVATRLRRARYLPEYDTRTPILVSPNGKPRNVESTSRETDIYVQAGRSGRVSGRLQQYSHDVKLPLSDEFQPMYTIRLDTPLGAGDSGSMVRDAETGGIFGFVVAVNGTGSTATVMPITSVLDNIKETADVGDLEPQYRHNPQYREDQEPLDPPETQDQPVAYDEPSEPPYYEPWDYHELPLPEVEYQPEPHLPDDDDVCVCGEIFPRENDLQRHIERGKCGMTQQNAGPSTPSEPRFPCRLCGRHQGDRAYKRLDDFCKHLKKSHNMSNWEVDKHLHIYFPESSTW
ncbi:hypothetical protein B0T14DRAFT_276698 [Immersiella caudata]|uniref:C2H2-type domain-containing protein n=1 Tax=Immersiella caudata TaxID=314043 RepID=A0AA39WDE5_9PEZI|nr:hypothetical protein B0T14DRAFT_276698 [Immersiella caudata]